MSSEPFSFVRSLNTASSLLHTPPLDLHCREHIVAKQNLPDHINAFPPAFLCKLKLTNSEKNIYSTCQISHPRMTYKENGTLSNSVQEPWDAE